jgi:hypothetical protein
MSATSGEASPITTRYPTAPASRRMLAIEGVCCAGLDACDRALRRACPLREGSLREAGELAEGEDEVSDADRVSLLGLLVDRRAGAERERRPELVPNPILGSRGKRPLRIAPDVFLPRPQM